MDTYIFFCGGKMFISNELMYKKEEGKLDTFLKMCVDKSLKVLQEPLQFPFFPFLGIVNAGFYSLKTFEIIIF